MVSMNIKSDRELILKEYHSFKEKGQVLLKRKKYEKGLAYLELAARIAWKYPVLESYCDEEMEFFLSEFTTKNFPQIKGDISGKRVVFYNGQIVDRGALTEQYLHYFLENNYEVLFIVSDKTRTIRGGNILSIISQNEKITLVIPKSKNILQNIKYLRDTIEEFKPNKAFLHFIPNDILGFCAFSNTRNFEKYYIVHNDHTFWLGKKCSDKFIEFREFGISIAMERRKIENDKLLLLPFYPINDKTLFRGFPFDRADKIVGISGAAIYKYLADEKLDYLYAIKDLLIENPEFIFCLCAFGESKKITDFITVNNLQDRFFFLGKRDDFYSLVGNSDILFESYPLKGGLTPLFAIEQNIPAIGIANFSNWSGSLEQILGIANYIQPQNIDEFKTEANKLIKSKTEREKLSSILKKNRLNKADFEQGLSDILNNNFEKVKIKKVDKLELNDDETLLSYLNLVDDLKNDLLITKIITLKKHFSFLERISIMIGLLFRKNLSIRVKLVNFARLTLLKN